MEYYSGGYSQYLNKITFYKVFTLYIYKLSYLHCTYRIFLSNVCFFLLPTFYNIWNLCFLCLLYDLFKLHKRYEESYSKNSHCFM